MRAFGEIRLIVFKLGTHAVHCRSICVHDWPEWEHAGWTCLAIDPEDDIAYSYWTHQGMAELKTLI